MKSNDNRDSTIQNIQWNSWGALMSDRVRSHPEKIWMKYIDGNTHHQEFTYREFIDSARRVATFLYEHDIRRGMRVAVADHNHPDVIIAYFACWLLGATAVPLNMTEDDTRLTYIITNSESQLVLARTQYVSRIQNCVSQIKSETGSVVTIVNVDTDSESSEFDRIIKECRSYDFPDTGTIMLQDECLIVYTSGTTGKPKGVVLVQENLFADGVAIAKWHGITADVRMMCILPVHHVNGTIVTHVTPFIAGSSVVLRRKFSPSTFFRTISDEQVNIVSVVPTILAFLLETHTDSHDAVLHGFSHIICGAGPLTCELADRFESAYNIPIVHGYGLSETTCYSCFLPLDLSPREHQHWMQDFGFPSIGVALPCNEMAIHDGKGQALTEGMRGEIVARGRNVMKGYFKNDEANADAFTYGWFRSGDEGFFKCDEYGREFYFITGRIKEIIIRGGVNIAPLEIDEVINKAPGVKAGICVGFEHELYGEEVGALVIPTSQDTDIDAILRFLTEHLPHHKAPKVVLLTDELPVTSTGKYQRNTVKHLFAQYKTTQFKKEVR